MELKKTQRNGRSGTIKTRLVLVPLLVVIIVVSAISAASSWFSRESLLNQMEENGYYTARQFISRVEDNADSLEALNGLLEEKILTAARMAVRNEVAMSDAFLLSLVADFGISDLYWYDSGGSIIYSTVPEYIGWQPDPGHPVHQFMISGEESLMEDIRMDTESGNYFKYGYLRSNSGDFIQVGIPADEVQALTYRFSYQSLVENMALSDEIIYALVMDQDLKTIAHNDMNELNIVFDDEGSISAAQRGVPYSQMWDFNGESVFDVIFPAVINGELQGAVAIGFSMADVNAAITRNFSVAIGGGLVGLLLLGLILYSTSNSVIKTLRVLGSQASAMAEGDFRQDLPAALSQRNDEIGGIAEAIRYMQDSMKKMIRNVIEASEQVAASSEELTATSQQSATASDEVARTIEEIAKGAGDQAKDTEKGAMAANELGEVVEKDKQALSALNQSTDSVTRLKDEGVRTLKELIVKTQKSSQGSAQVHEVILNTNNSADRINQASGMIKNIAEQTNLLALNAAIEAARAGEAGRGFAVVADEIRKLAEESNRFTGEISTIMAELTGQTGNAVKTMEEVAKIIEAQSDSVEETNQKFAGISTAIETMKQAIREVNTSGLEIENKKDEITQILQNLSAISQENAAGSEEASASVEEQTAAMAEIANSSEELSQIAEELNRLVQQFKI
ncbi:methyl-accepting chemotaxis protein [Anoxynatronum buryatiense]|uniref:Methyl-accepting chemotaxis protein n=1 Tax=Anoxynatronum buryatiense TaxID=489973 RepID=A0AA45WXE8_9CLOT|nr:methyl-accepting chemotaxis protein [Anoxynatronum buryatiense]SMP64101.1 methyl-accepting chemotaxis protein [Anoxynatronum buryatiense]